MIHFLIDGIKRYTGDTARSFVVDQAIHAASLFGLAWFLIHFSILSGFSGIGYKPLVVLAGFVATVRGASFLVGKVATRLMKENKLQLDGLVDGGKRIGQLERALIFLLIFINEPAGIGFLVAAKSILRFEEAKKQDLAEYVIIGTLLSFSLAIALAVSTKWAMDL